MFEFMKPLRAGAIGLGAVAVALGTSMSASAQSSPAAAPATEVSEAPAADAQIVVKDGDTGKLRAATPEEANALRAGRANARAGRGGASMEARSHWSGARGARLTDESMTFSVVVKRADGTLVELCVEGAETTAKVVASAPRSKPATLPTE
jgi:hypothetical protein